MAKIALKACNVDVTRIEHMNAKESGWRLGDHIESVGCVAGDDHAGRPAADGVHLAIAIGVNRRQIIRDARGNTFEFRAVAPKYGAARTHHPNLFAIVMHLKQGA